MDSELKNEVKVFRDKYVKFGMHLKRILLPEYSELYSRILDTTKNLDILESTSDSKLLLANRFYWILNDISDFPECQYCHKKMIRLVKGKSYPKYCSISCSTKDHMSTSFEKRKKTMIEKTGYAFPIQNPDTKKRIQNTNLKRYGASMPFKSKYIQNKIHNEVFPELYSGNAPICDEKIKEKIKQTNVEKLGVENPFAAEEIKEKIKETNLERYGVESYSQTAESRQFHRKRIKLNLDELREKCKSTNKEKYGVENPFASEEIKEKIKQTNLEKYGKENYAQTPEYHKSKRHKYEYADMTFDSSWEMKVAKFCIEHNIEFEYQPNISFEYVYDGKTHFYFPDFLINGKLYEVKGDHFFNESGQMQNPYDHSQDGLYKAKHQCMIKNNIVIISGSNIDKLSMIF